MGIPQKADWREERRKRALALKQQGWLQKDIALALGVRARAVSQWLKRAHEQGGAEALSRRPPGMTSRLVPGQRAQIPALLARGAEAHGFRSDVWTAARVAEVIHRAFDVRYHRHHVSWLLCQLGWSRQQPVQRPMQRDAAAIRRWHEEYWSALKRGRRQKGAPSSGKTIRASICPPGGVEVGAAPADADPASQVDARPPLSDHWLPGGWPRSSSSRLQPCRDPLLDGTHPQRQDDCRRP